MVDTLIIIGAKYLVFLVVLAAGWPLIRFAKKERISYVLRGAVALIDALVLTKVAASLYFDPRPFTHGAHALISHAADNGFPSDHTVLAATAAAVAYTVDRRLGSILLGGAALVALCRVASGVHSPIDVIAGFAIGLASVWLGKKLAGSK